MAIGSARDKGRGDNRKEEKYTLDKLRKLPVQPVLTRSGVTALMETRLDNGWRAVHREWLVLADKHQLARLQHPALEIIEQASYDELGLTLIRVRVAPRADSRQALNDILPASLRKLLDRNHIYAPQQDPANGYRGKPENLDITQTLCTDPAPLGMVDTAIRQNHKGFANTTIEEHSFVPAGLRQPLAHGTAVAGRMVAGPRGTLPLLHNAQLYVAAAFYAREDGSQGATTSALVESLNWLAGQRVKIINMSLAGPPNRVLEQALLRLQQRGVLVVAAVGNDGPAAAPLYPAAYPSVIGVTAVDRQQRIYRWANRGPQVDIAAPGVSVVTARADGEFGRESGTSMAAPVVSAWLACQLQQADWSPEEARRQLARRATDLGKPGPDPVFGAGLLSLE